MDNILNYMAGFLDGEGHIGIKKLNNKRGLIPTYSERVSVAGTKKLSIIPFNDLMSGYLYHHKASKLSKCGYWSWEVTDKKAKLFLEMILPYLREKWMQANLVLALGKNKEKNHRRPVSQKDFKLREDLYTVLKLLHQRHE